LEGGSRKQGRVEEDLLYGKIVLKKKIVKEPPIGPLSSGALPHFAL